MLYLETTVYKGNTGTTDTLIKSSWEGEVTWLACTGELRCPDASPSMVWIKLVLVQLRRYQDRNCKLSLDKISVDK